MKKAIGFTISFFLFLIPAYCQFDSDDDLLLHLMMKEPDQFLPILRQKDSLEIQIIYTQINRDANNMPAFRSFYFNVDPQRYFYPASTIKLPIVLMALEKLKQLYIHGLSRDMPIVSDSVYSGQLTVHRDSTSETGLPSIGHYIKKILVVSDNAGYNELYEFLGQREANERFQRKGYTARFLHRLERALTPDENRHTEAIRLLRNDTVIYSQPMLINDSIPVREKALRGIGYYREDTLINEPFDFTYKNFFPLTEQQQVLRAILFPMSVAPRQRFDITTSDRLFVLKYMSQLPTETAYPAYYYDSAYYPGYSKLLMFANRTDTIPSNLRIFNKYGDAYGYLIDNAYIVDFDRGLEFMLSAVISANPDGIYNDNKYAHKDIAYPFMRHLGQLIYRHEVHRVRLKKPDLKEFRFQYDRQVGNR